MSAIYSIWVYGYGQLYPSNIGIFNCNFTNNTLGIHSKGNITILGCNIINNTQGILINSTEENITINYNRILNNTIYNLNTTNSNINIDFNWWGNNTPDMINKIIGIIPNNYFVMHVTNVNSLDPNGTVTFNYTFRLDTGENADNDLLPYFVTDIYTNITSGIITSFDARFDNLFDVNVNNSGSILYIVYY